MAPPRARLALRCQGASLATPALARWPSELANRLPERLAKVFRIGLKYIMLIGLACVAGMGALNMSQLRSGGPQPAPSYLLTHPRRDTLMTTVRATGQFEPARAARLEFATTGQVSEVLVAVGDQVAAGSPLARLYHEELTLRVVQAEAALDQARASYQMLARGASEEELAAAEAQVRQARGQLIQAQGSVSEADLRAAEAQLQEAEARLQQVEAGPPPLELSAAQAQLQEAQLNLQAQRDQLSAAKTSAQRRMEVAANVLRDSQAEYSRVYWYNRRAEERGNLTAFLANMETEALHAVENAELLLEQAQVAYDQARQAEVNGVAAAEMQVRSAAEELEALQAGAAADELAAARAQVAVARARLDNMRGVQRDGAMFSAQAAVDQAEAQLAEIQAGALPDDLTIAQTQVQSAEAALDMAQLAYEHATLTAPFAGVVTEMNLSIGETRTSAGGAAVALADTSRLFVTMPVGEADVVHLAVGQPATLTLQALPEVALTGTIEAISPAAQLQSAVTTYQLRIGTAVSDPRVRIGMTANVEIVVNQKPNALLIPRRAVYSSGERRVVDVLANPDLCATPPEEYPGDVERVQRTVTTGLASEQMIEIIAGLDESACVYVMGVDPRTSPIAPAVGGP